MARSAAAFTLFGLCLALAVCGGPEANRQAAAEPAALAIPSPLPTLIQAALDDPRRAMHRGADQRRHPGELIAASGLRAGDRVLDPIPGDGYWTRLFSRIVGREGRVYAVWPKNYADVAPGNVATLRQIAASPDYPNASVEVQQSPILTAPEPLDMVWTVRNYHD